MRLSIIGVFLFAGAASAQSPQERIDKYQTEVLKLITQRLDDQQAVLDRLAATPNTPAAPNGRTRLLIDGMEMQSKEEAMIVLAIYAFDYYDRERQGLKGRIPQATVINPPPGYRPNHPNIRVTYATDDGLIQNLGSKQPRRNK